MEMVANRRRASCSVLVEAALAQSWHRTELMGHALRKVLLRMAPSDLDVSLAAGKGSEVRLPKLLAN